MTPDQLLDSYHRFKFREDVSHDLLKHRINEILLVSTFYDAYIFEQDGVLSEQLLGEYSQLNLSAPPRVHSVPTAADALAALDQRKIDLVITTMHIGDVSPFELAARVKAARPALIVVLAGHPGGREQEFRTAGFDEFIHLRSNVRATLAQLQRLAGVLP